MLTELEIEFARAFKISDDNIGNALDSADNYGQSLVDFRFARRFFVLMLDDQIICYPTDQDDRNLSVFLEYYLDNKN